MLIKKKKNNIQEERLPAMTRKAIYRQECIGLCLF